MLRRCVGIFNLVRFVLLFRFVSIIDYSRPSVSIFVLLVALSSRVSCVYHAFVTLVSVFAIERSRDLGLGRVIIAFVIFYSLLLVSRLPDIVFFLRYLIARYRST